jgi:hypothetical protein
MAVHVLETIWWNRIPAFELEIKLVQVEVFQKEDAV